MPDCILRDARINALLRMRGFLSSLTLRSRNGVSKGEAEEDH